jgi:autotransporter strand-loop-strand O-heptosyltransferase
MKTLINFITDSLGDNIAFSPYADIYQKKFGGQVFVKTKWHNILSSDNENVFFVDKNYSDNFDKTHNICFEFVAKPMQKIVCDQLGIEYKEIIPKIKDTNKFSFKKKKKYICISVHSTSQMKYWNNNTGWDKVVRYLKEYGYDVYVIDKNECYGTKEKWNCVPKKALNETGDYPIEYRIAQIKNCEFFIGLSSGLTWLAWALGKKVITISGCSLPDSEFFCNNYRVINQNVCHGCLVDSSIDNVKGILSGWSYCPRNKNFECTKEISFEMVKEKIDLIMKSLK